MTPNVLLEGLSGVGVELWRDGDKLRCRGPRRALTPELVEGLRQHKEEILERLEEGESPEASRRRDNLQPARAPEPAIRDTGEVLELARARLGEIAPEHKMDVPYPPPEKGTDPLVHRHTAKARFFRDVRTRDRERRQREGLPPWIRVVDGGGRMRLGRGPSPMGSRIVRTLRKYYAYLAEAAHRAIILEEGPFPSSHPTDVWTAAERRGVAPVLQNGRKWSAEWSSIGRRSATPARLVVSGLGKAQTPAPWGPNDYPNPRVLEDIAALAPGPRPMGVLERASLSTELLYKLLFAAAFPTANAAERAGGPYAEGRGRPFHLPSLSTQHIEQLNKAPRPGRSDERGGSMFDKKGPPPGLAFGERNDPNEWKRSKWYRELQERGELDLRYNRRGGPSSPPVGRDHLGRAYLSDSLPWVQAMPGTGRVRVDVELAAQAGFEITRRGAVAEVRI